MGARIGAAFRSLARFVSAGSFVGKGGRTIRRGLLQALRRSRIRVAAANVRQLLMKEGKIPTTSRRVRLAERGGAGGEREWDIERG